MRSLVTHHSPHCMYRGSQHDLPIVWQQYKERDPEKYLTFFVGIRKPAAAQGEEGPQQDVDSGDFVVYSMTKGDVTTMVQNIMLFKPNSTTKK
jgi:hypothetical protein